LHVVLSSRRQSGALALNVLLAPIGFQNKVAKVHPAVRQKLLEKQTRFSVHIGYLIENTETCRVQLQVRDGFKALKS
jgi:hypothetical protein